MIHRKWPKLFLKMLSPISLISHNIFWHFPNFRVRHISATFPQFLSSNSSKFENKRTQKSLTNLSLNFQKESFQKCPQSPFPFFHCCFCTRPSAAGHQFLAKFAAMVNQEVTLDGAFTNQAIIVFKLVFKNKGGFIPKCFCKLTKSFERNQ
jgi:hypothetical protein